MPSGSASEVRRDRSIVFVIWGDMTMLCKILEPHLEEKRDLQEVEGQTVARGKVKRSLVIGDRF